MEKLPITAFIVAKNESNLLDVCLARLDFCNEIIVADLDSEDSTCEVAIKYGAKIIKAENEDFGEIVMKKYIHVSKNNWVIITDPDEVLNSVLSKEVQILFKIKLYDKITNIACVNVPILYYYKGEKLKGTPWGGLKYRPYLIHKENFCFEERVHGGRSVKIGFKNYIVKYNGDNFIEHYWNNSISQFIESHKRYLLYEGKSRFENGKRTTLFNVILEPFKQFFLSYIKYRGVKDGLNGFTLSVLRSWYFTVANLELYKYQVKKK